MEFSLDLIAHDESTTPDALSAARRPYRNRAPGEIAPIGVHHRLRQRLAPVRQERYTSQVTDRTLLILIGGRAALTEVLGVPSVMRHVACARRLGVEPVAVYPANLTELGAEIATRLGEGVAVISANDLGPGHPALGSSVLVSVADWYLSFGTMLAFVRGTEGRARAEVVERDAPCCPLARVDADELPSLLARLETETPGLVLQQVLSGAQRFSPETSDRQRLSDDASAVLAEEKLLDSVFGHTDFLHGGHLRRVIAAPIARYLTRLAPHFILLSGAQTAMGLAAAWILAYPGYAAGLLGASAYFMVRSLNGALAAASRATAAESARREMLDASGDTLMQLAVLAAITIAVGPEAKNAAIVAATGLVLATALAWFFVLRDIWAAHESGSVVDEPADEFLSRFVQRDGAALALLFAGCIGRLDLFLFAAALSAHLFYFRWFLARRRHQSPVGPNGSAGLPW